MPWVHIRFAFPYTWSSTEPTYIVWQYNKRFCCQYRDTGKILFYKHIGLVLVGYSTHNCCIFMSFLPHDMGQLYDMYKSNERPLHSQKTRAIRKQILFTMSVRSHGIWHELNSWEILWWKSFMAIFLQFYGIPGELLQWQENGEMSAWMMPGAQHYFIGPWEGVLLMD